MRRQNFTLREYKPLHIFIWLLVFVVSLTVLVKASDYFVEGAEAVGLSYGMPHFVIGVVIVGFGTSLPELVSSIFAVLHGTSEIVIGNVLGSNITNIFLVLGIAAVGSTEFRFNHNLLRVDLPIFLGATILVALTVTDGEFSIGEAFFCLIGLVIYMFSALDAEHRFAQDDKKETATSVSAWVKLIASPLLIFAGAKYTIDAVVVLSETLDIGAEIIAMSAIALGTSLPEVFVTLRAVRKGKPEMAIGNIMGSNAFNAFAVLGIPRLIGPLEIPDSVIDYTLPVFFVAALLFVIVTVDEKVNRWEGWLMLMFYLFFISRLFQIV
jgi:cation:H+ antiporter